jgi:hypothetical protein
MIQIVVKEIDDQTKYFVKFIGGKVSTVNEALTLVALPERAAASALLTDDGTDHLILVAYEDDMLVGFFYQASLDISKSRLEWINMQIRFV